MPSVTIDTTVDINAGKDAVWDVLTRVASYKQWELQVRAVATRIGGQLARLDPSGIVAATLGPPPLYFAPLSALLMSSVTASG
jgi:hypothetical protein